MHILAGLILAESVTALPIGVITVFALALAFVALLGRRGMPAGLGEGTFIAAVSGGAVLLLAVNSDGSLSRAAFGHVLTGLTVLWYAISRFAARLEPTTRSRGVSPAEDEAERQRSLVWAYAALVCGFAAVVNISSASNLPAWATDYAVLLVLSVLVWVFRTGSWSPYPAIALLVFLLVIVIPGESLRGHASAWGVGLNAAGLLCLVVVVGTVLLDWRRRRRQWLEEPERLVETLPARRVLLGVLVGVCVLVGLGGVLLRGAWFTPPAVWLAGLACLVIGHVRTWPWASEIGLGLVAEGIISASLAWLTPGWPGAVFGLCLAGGYLLWLARFWDQQLNDGEAWTTAGRLIPISRRLGYAISMGAVAAAMGAIAAGDFATQNVWMTGLTVLLLLGGMSLLVRDGFEHRQSGAAASACVVTLAAAGPGCALLSGLLGMHVLLVVGIAAGMFLLALRVAASAGRYGAADARSGCYTVYIAYLGGMLPVVVLFALSWRGLTVQTALALVFAIAAVLVGAMVLRGAGRVAELGRA